MGLTTTEDAVDLVEENREDIKLLLIHFRLRRKIYSLSLRCVALSQKVQLAWAIGVAVMNYRSEKRLKSSCR